MRNLKKFLALVLAMMMTLSLMVTVNAATTATSDFTDADSITKEFRDGVAVLEGLKVFTGYTNGDKFDFRPKNNITRAEVATIVYRLATGDVAGDQAHLYADYQKFDDVKADHWAAGYINYCANAEWIAGYGNGKFGPNDDVTGYQAAAMILRAVGYGKNNEFKGSGWQVQVANVTRSKGLLDRVDKTTYANTLNQAAPRELVAEILFQAGLIPQVTWTQLGGYSEYNNVLGAGINTSKNPSLSQQNFKLSVDGWHVIDEWGNPGYEWYQGSTSIATIEAVPDMSFTNTQHECDVAHELKINTQQDFMLFVNGGFDSTGTYVDSVTDNYRIVATDTTTKVGGQGRLTKFYKTQAHPWNDKLGTYGSLTPVATMVDTFLAKVTQVTEVKLDGNNHVIVPATLTLAVYDKPQTADKTPAPTTTVVTKKTTDKTNWDYSVGDMILMNAYTNHAAGIDPAVPGTPVDHTADQPRANKAAFEAEQVPDTTLIQGVSAWVNGIAKQKVAKQTTLYWNQAKHCVDGTDTPDQLDLFLDVAGSTTNSNFTWYYDQYDNIIGIGDAIQSNYGVITSLYSSFNAADGATDGTAVAKAHVKFSNGSEGDLTIDRFLVVTYNLTNGHYNSPGQGDVNKGRNTAELFPVYDYAVSGDVMKGVVDGNYTSGVVANKGGNLLVSPVASINKNADTNGSGRFGVIEKNLFKFVTAGDGKVTAVEVAGASYDTITGGTAAAAADSWTGHYNDAMNAADKLYKNGSYLTTNVGSTIRLGNDTQIMVYNPNTKAITCYDGTDDLPGNVSIAAGAEVDWADVNNDGIADHLYVTGTVDGTLTHNLFYYNGGAAVLNTDGTGTLQGWLDGDAATVTFANEKLFTIVRNSVSAYAGHMFAVEITDGKVTNLFGTHNVTASTGSFAERFVSTAAAVLNDGTTAGIMKNKTAVKDILLTDGISTDSWSASDAGVFVTGVLGGNSYTKTTKVVGGTITGAAGIYNSANGTLGLFSDSFSLVGNSKVVGDDLAYLNLAGRKSDVTIVYEDNAVNSIVAIYVTTEPDNTTPGVPGSAAATKINSGVNAWVVSARSNSELVATLIQAGRAGNAVVFDANADGNNAVHDAGVAGKTIYFPYVYTTNAQASLQVVDNTTGDVVWLEGMTHTTSPNMVGVMYFNITTTAPGGSETYGATPLIAGHTYSFTIYLNGTTLVSSGTFTAS